MLRIYPAETDEDLEQVRILFQEYADFLKQVLSEYLTLPWFIDYLKKFDQESANLPGEYAPPTGCLLLAKYKDQPAGCVAIRKLSDGVCEGKRLYVRPEFRGLKVGRKLVEAIIAKARKIGYSSIRGDTLESMKAARALYASLGFKETESYYHDPIEGAKFIELKLT